MLLACSWRAIKCAVVELGGISLEFIQDSSEDGMMAQFIKEKGDAVILGVGHEAHHIAAPVANAGNVGHRAVGIERIASTDRFAIDEYQKLFDPTTLP